MPQHKLNLIGQRFGMLVVTIPASSIDGRSRWWCECDCGSKSIKTGASLRAGNTQSCGCRLREWRKEHVRRDRLMSKSHTEFVDGTAGAKVRRKMK